MRTNCLDFVTITVYCMINTIMISFSNNLQLELGLLESMAGPRLSQSCGHSRWKQWWRRSPNTCCSKKILLLLVWHVLFTLSFGIMVFALLGNIVSYISIFLSYSFAPLIGWLADVKFGRYEVGSIASFLASILYYFSIFAGGGVSTSITSCVLLLIVIGIVSFGFTCYMSAMLPFITDQINRGHIR